MTETPARPAPLFADIDDVAKRLAETGYLPDTATATAVFLADRLGKPLLVEGGGIGLVEGQRRRVVAGQAAGRRRRTGLGVAQSGGSGPALL